MVVYKEFISYNKKKEGEVVRVPVKEYVPKFKDLHDNQILISSYVKKNGTRVLQMRKRSASTDHQKKHLLHHISFRDTLHISTQDPHALYFATEDDKALWSKKVKHAASAE